MRTCLSREFAFLGRETAVFRGCPGRDEWPGSAETREAREYVAERRRYLCRALFQYRTAGDEVGDDAADLIADARPAVMSARSRCKAGRSVVAPENPPSSYTQQKNIGRLRIFMAIGARRPAPQRRRLARLVRLCGRGVVATEQWTPRLVRHLVHAVMGDDAAIERWLAMKASQASRCACAISASSRRSPDRPIVASENLPSL